MYTTWPPEIAAEPAPLGVTAVTLTSVSVPPSGSTSLASTSMVNGTGRVVPESLAAFGGVFGTGCTTTLIVPAADSPSASAIVYRTV